ncbi:MAG: hypothetical protein ACFFDN_38360 [Candidatus Hodarchaeota archaeon]
MKFKWNYYHSDLIENKLRDEGMSEIGYPHNRVVANTLHNTLERVFGAENWRELSGLLIFSGGLDSTALLVNILEETNQRLHVHHIEIQNFENRAQVENDAVKKILVYCKQHYHEFSYSTSKFEFDCIGGLDSSLALFMASRVHLVLKYYIDIIYLGFVSNLVA